MNRLYRFVRRHTTPFRGIVLLTAVLLLFCALDAYYVYEIQFEPSHIVAECEHAQYKLVCFADQINNTFAHRGLAAAFDVLAAAYAADPDFAESCHGNTHDLGQAAYEEFHRTGTIELTSKVSYCGYGFYHGFMIALLAETHDLNEARAFCAYAGSALPTPGNYSEGACYHGIGHGVTDGSDPGVWGNAAAIAEPGLELCTQVARTDKWQGRCYAGVFNSVAEMYPHPKYKLTAAGDPFALCETPKYTALEKEACFAEMNSLAVTMGHNDLLASLSFTRNITDMHYRSIAVQNVADYYVKMNKNGPANLPATDTLLCATLGPVFQNDCIDGLMDGVWEFGPPGNGYDEAIAICNADILPTDIASACFDRIQSTARDFYSPATIPEICALIPDRFKTAPCLSPTPSRT